VDGFSVVGSTVEGLSEVFGGLESSLQHKVKSKKAKPQGD
jgi:hypothetical protein